MMMKQLNKILIALTLVIFSCESERDLAYLENVALPEDITATYNITQDNTGLVTITPSALNASSLELYLGDQTEDPVALLPGESVDHIYTEGTYEVRIVAYSINGQSREASQQLVVSFQAPTNLLVILENNSTISRQVDITVTADFATLYDFYTGDAATPDPISSNIGETISYLYPEGGIYSIRIVAKGAAIETTEYTEDFEVTEILQPLESAAIPPVRNDSDVISIFSSAYNDIANTDFNPNWGQATIYTPFDLSGDAMLQYSNMNYQGIQLDSDQDISNMEYIYLDVWTANMTDLEISLINNTTGGATEAPVTVPLTLDDWTSVQIPISDYTDQGLVVDQIFQLKLVDPNNSGGTVFIDNLYFWKSPPAASGIEGIWQIAPEAGALKVGPAPNSDQWWFNTLADVTTRACYFDDKYVLSLDGNFHNILDGETWLEGWQNGGVEECGTPVAPHDGSNAATFDFNTSTNKLTITGTGSYMGLPKAVNSGELPNVGVPNSVTYDVTLTNNNNVLTLVIEAGTGVFWTFKLIRYTSPVEGTWKIAPEAGALKVGPAPNSDQWWSNALADVTTRACYFDDNYIFNSDGSFQNILGPETWLEGWQTGTDDACGAPISPHDGSSSSSYSYDENTGQLTLVGTGAYLGLPKAVNAGELPSVAVPSSVTYETTLANNNTEMIVVIEAGNGVFWTYKLIK